MSNPKDAEAEELNVAGNDLAKLGRFEEAAALYSRAIAVDPSYAEPWYNRGKAKLNVQDLRGAVVDLTEALRLDPSDPDAYNNRGIARKQLGRLDEAIADYTMALLLNPSLERVYFNRGIALYEMGDQDQACADFRRAASMGVSQALDALRQAGCE